MRGRVLERQAELMRRATERPTEPSARLILASMEREVERLDRPRPR